MNILNSGDSPRLRVNIHLAKAASTLPFSSVLIVGTYLLIVDDESLRLFTVPDKPLTNLDFASLLFDTLTPSTSCDRDISPSNLLEPDSMSRNGLIFVTTDLYSYLHFCELSGSCFASRLPEHPLVLWNISKYDLSDTWHSPAALFYRTCKSFSLLYHFFQQCNSSSHNKNARF